MLKQFAQKVQVQFMVWGRMGLSPILTSWIKTNVFFECLASFGTEFAFMRRNGSKSLNYLKFHPHLCKQLIFVTILTSEWEVSS